MSKARIDFPDPLRGSLFEGCEAITERGAEMLSVIAETLVDLTDMLRDSFLDCADTLVQCRGKTFGLHR
jgi:hypothetical protein